MLKRKDIIVTTRDLNDRHGERLEITASTSARSTHLLDRYAIRAARSGEVIEIAKEQVTRSVWHHFYGDLIRPAHELMHAARYSCRMEDVDYIGGLCKQLDALLVFPRE